MEELMTLKQLLKEGNIPEALTWVEELEEIVNKQTIIKQAFDLIVHDE